MFGFKKTKSASEEQPSQNKVGLFNALTKGLKRTRQQITEGMANLLFGKKEIDAELLQQMETQLLVADVGTQATQRIVNDMLDRVKRRELIVPSALFKALRAELLDILTPCSVPWVIPTSESPYVILMVGINGAGKTTTIGKLAHHLQQQGKSVMLAAGDTFRAAAIEQLQAWGAKNRIPVIAQHSGADSASVIYDALAAARARKIDVLIADTAGRLHTQSHLMEELKKVKRVMMKLDANAPHETMLVLDAGIGQNALRQAALFDEAIKLSSLTLTKLDGTAKGGIIFALADSLRLPIRFVGVGEGIEDLQTFDANAFVQALFPDVEP